MPAWYLEEDEEAAGWAASVFSGDLNVDSCFVSRVQGLDCDSSPGLSS